MTDNLLIPEEILINIFDYLSPKAVKICCLVCKRWNSIIGNSKQIMRKFQLNLEESDEMIYKARDLKRRHQSVKLKNLNENSIHMISLHNLCHIQLSCCKVESQKLVQVLISTPLLEVFNAKGVDFIDDFPYSCKKVSLQLKELRLEYCNINIVDFFDTSTLKIFEVSSFLTEECDGIIKKLLKKQNNLKEFSVGGIICDDFFCSSEILEFNFRLRSLKIDKTSMKKDRNELLFKFLLRHRDSLSSLKIHYPIDSDVHKFILENLNNLKHLEISVAILTEMNQNFFNTLPKNHIESIRLFGIFSTLNKAKSILSIFGNIKYLDLSQITISNWFMEFLLHISKSLRNLVSLKVPNLFNPNVYPNIYFPHLKDFSVAKIYDDTVYNRFIRQHSGTLENIFIGWTDDNFIKGLTVDEFMNCSNLKQVTICSYSPLVTRMFNKISKRTKPWILESRVKMVLDYDYIRLRFQFPDDKAVWDDRCRIWSDEVIREFSTVENYGLNAFVNKYK